MLKFIQMVLIILLVTFNTITKAADALHDGMTEIDNCENATESNIKARYWLTKIANEQPVIDEDYFEKINSSPWCYVVNNGNNHNTVYQYNSDSSVSKNGIIHKAGESQWIKNNWGKVKRMCVLPYDIYTGSTIFRSYKNPVNNGRTKACAILKSPTSEDGLLHQSGKATKK